MDRLSVEGRRMEELGEVDVVVVEGRIVMGDNKPVSLLGVFLLFLGSVGNLSLRLCLSCFAFEVRVLRSTSQTHDMDMISPHTTCLHFVQGCTQKRT